MTHLKHTTWILCAGALIAAGCRARSWAPLSARPSPSNPPRFTVQPRIGADGPQLALALRF